MSQGGRAERVGFLRAAIARIEAQAPQLDGVVAKPAPRGHRVVGKGWTGYVISERLKAAALRDRKSTRLNSSH